MTILTTTRSLAKLPDLELKPKIKLPKGTSIREVSITGSRYSNTVMVEVKHER